MDRSNYQPDGKVDGFEVDPTERSFTLREIALVQSFSNGIIQDVKNITLQRAVSNLKRNTQSANGCFHETVFQTH